MRRGYNKLFRIAAWTPCLENPEPTTPHVSYGELARLFLRLSLVAFGGPVAHIALGEQEIVVRHKWLTREHYLDLIAATNLIPGPNSTEVMIHVGYTLCGIPGAILTGTCFIGPTFLLTLFLSIIYVSSGNIPQVNALLWGIKPVMVAIIANVAYRLVLTALKTPALWALFALSIAAIVLLDVPEVLVMLGAGVVFALVEVVGRRGEGHSMFLWMVAVGTNLNPSTSLMLALETGRIGLGDIFLYFLRIGSVLFGSGYVLIAYIQQDLVNTFGWLTSRQLLDAIAIGQVTPGPVSTAATVVGYIMAGVPGAVVATLGIFLPSFVLVILTAPLIPRMRSSPITGAFLTGVNAGVVAAILLTLFDLTRAALLTPDGASFSPIAIGVSLVSLALLVRTKINATWLIAAGGVVGLLFGS
jgi:chromate transporter